MKIWRIGWIGAVILGGFILGGCGKTTDIEDWDYVVAIGIRPEGDQYCFSFHISEEKDTKIEECRSTTLENAISAYEDVHEKSLHFGHCAAVLFAEEMFSDQKLTPQVNRLLEEIIHRNEITLQTNVYAVQGDVTRFAKGKIVGQYMNKLLHNNKKEWEKSAAIYHLYQLAYGNTKEYSLIAFQIQDKEVCNLKQIRITQ